MPPTPFHPYSTNARELLSRSYTSEGLLQNILALRPSETQDWLRSNTPIDIDALISKLRSLPWDQPTTPSKVLTDILELAQEFPNELSSLNTEDLLLAMLYHDNNCGRHVFEDQAGEYDTRTELVKALGMSLRTVESRVREWKRKRGGRTRRVADVVEIGSRGEGGRRTELPMLPSLEDDAKLVSTVRGPTSESNWLVPGRVIVGALPGGYYGSGDSLKKELTKILAFGVTTFVSLIEDVPPYRDCLTRMGCNVTSVSFPIDDFGTADDEETRKFVELLTGLVSKGEVLYIHCLSGRGRTGTVAIPLLMSLYPSLEVADAVKFCNAYKRIGRIGDTRKGSMPEVEEQMEQIEDGKVEYKRGGFKAKAKSKHK